MSSPAVFNITDERDLKSLAKALIEFAGDVKVWAFYGEMGSGKTTFIRSICRELNVIENVSSPTFAIVNEYSTAEREKVFHFDFYRIKKEEEAVDIGCEEYFDSGFLCLIEWPEKIINLLPHPHIKISITVVDQERRITFSHD